MKYQIPPMELKVVRLRDCGPATVLADTPERVAEYWNEHIKTDVRFNPDVESLVLLLVNTRRRRSS